MENFEDWINVYFAQYPLLKELYENPDSFSPEPANRKKTVKYMDRLFDKVSKLQEIVKNEFQDKEASKDITAKENESQAFGRVDVSSNFVRDLKALIPKIVDLLEKLNDRFSEYTYGESTESSIGTIQPALTRKGAVFLSFTKDYVEHIGPKVAEGNNLRLPRYIVFLFMQIQDMAVRKRFYNPTPIYTTLRMIYRALKDKKNFDKIFREPMVEIFDNLDLVYDHERFSNSSNNIGKARDFDFERNEGVGNVRAFIKSPLKKSDYSIGSSVKAPDTNCEVDNSFRVTRSSSRDLPMNTAITHDNMFAEISSVGSLTTLLADDNQVQSQTPLSFYGTQNLTLSENFFSRGFKVLKGANL